MVSTDAATGPSRSSSGSNRNKARPRSAPPPIHGPPGHHDNDGLASLAPGVGAGFFNFLHKQIPPTQEAIDKFGAHGEKLQKIRDDRIRNQHGGDTDRPRATVRRKQAAVASTATAKKKPIASVVPASVTGAKLGTSTPKRALKPPLSFSTGAFKTALGS